MDPDPRERDEQEEGESPLKENSIIRPVDTLGDEDNKQTNLSVPSLNEEGLQSLTKMYQAMGESQPLQGVASSKPKTFSGMEVIEDPTLSPIGVETLHAKFTAMQRTLLNRLPRRYRLRRVPHEWRLTTSLCPIPSGFST
eukprot:scaffold376_cov454-Pavlova_lutheri.AAC.6